MKTYRGYDYIVFHFKRELMNHYNGYIRIPDWHPLYKKVDRVKKFDFAGRHHEHLDYDAIQNDVDVHGGFTFAERITEADLKRNRWPQGFVPGLWIGWDYAHAGDCFWDHDQDEKMDAMGLESHKHHAPFFNEKHWTENEVEQECKNAIDQLIEYKTN